MGADRRERAERGGEWEVAAGQTCGGSRLQGGGFRNNYGIIISKDVLELFV